jgi:hypothetical protein
MHMSVLVIRHGLSEANNRDNIKTIALASMDAPLMKQGQLQAEQLGTRLNAHYAVAVADKRIATSQLRRAQETAEKAGFQRIISYALLNEVAHGVVLPQLRSQLNNNILPNEAIDAAESLLDQPPVEDIWITHGLVIAGLCAVLNVYQDRSLIPRFCEIRELPLAS